MRIELLALAHYRPVAGGMVRHRCMLIRVSVCAVEWVASYACTHECTAEEEREVGRGANIPVSMFLCMIHLLRLVSRVKVSGMVPASWLPYDVPGVPSAVPSALPPTLSCGVRVQVSMKDEIEGGGSLRSQSKRPGAVARR
jgi:hypothetical protein